MSKTHALMKLNQFYSSNEPRINHTVLLTLDSITVIISLTIKDKLKTCEPFDSKYQKTRKLRKSKL